MFNNNPDFYPTPASLIEKMVSGIDFRVINSVLEPSAGKGNIVDRVKEKFDFVRSSYYNRDTKYDIDTIEVDENLQHILKGKKYRIVHNDFLTFHTYKKYDLIIMNPPFSEGDKHLLKALDMQESGGKIVCILNAETLKNPYTNIRKDLLNRLESYNAQVEFIKDAFLSAERTTNVEIALVKVDIPKADNDSIILDELRRQEHHKEYSDGSCSNIINADFIKGIIDQYNFEVRAGLKLIAEYKALRPYILNDIKDEAHSSPVLSLTLRNKDEDGNSTMENSYIKDIRMKYWRALFTSDQFMGLFTSNLREKYYSQIKELKDYDFSLYNIYTIKMQLNKDMIQGVEETILKLFEEFSHKHHWYDESSKNIHYYNGWKTNKAWKINKKVIIPLNGFGSWNDRLDYGWRVKEKLADIEKVFNYLDGGLTEDIDISSTLQKAEKDLETRKIRLKYFLVTFYKKGTCHIEFTNMDLLHKFNLFGSQRMGWLPPSYGKTSYKIMTPVEKSVIDEFEGELSYNKVLANRDYYIVETSKLLLIS